MKLSDPKGESNATGLWLLVLAVILIVILAGMNLGVWAMID